MGADIHFYVEKRVNGIWESADKWTPPDPDEEGARRPRVDYKDSFYHDRNYNLFAILADVRNGRGFAGVQTGEGFNPIADPRGLPEDVCEAVRNLSDDWGCDGHSHSHFTVQELMDYDWTQASTLQGFVLFNEFMEWSRWRRHNQESPESYCGGVGGGNIVKISMEDADAKLELLHRQLEEIGPAKGQPDTEELRQRRQAVHDEFVKSMKSTYVLCQWQMPYYRCARTFLGEVLPKLWRLGKPEDVRITFWFDN